MTIEKRAENLSDKIWDIHWESPFKIDFATEVIPCIIDTLKEQRGIDIEKAIKWLVEHECFGCEDSVLAIAFKEHMKGGEE